MLNWYLKRLNYLDAYLTNGPTWFVEVDGKRVAVLSECHFVDMFWYRYRVEPLSSNEADRQLLLSEKFWDPLTAMNRGYVFVDCDTGIPAEYSIVGGGFSPPYVVVRGLWGPMKYRLWPWDRIALWVRRAFKRKTRSSAIG